MIVENLIDGLNISGELSIDGLCEDYIYGKHTAYLYNNNKTHKKEVLECIHIDIWGLSQVQSMGGASYFMIIIDSFSLY